MRLPCCKQVNKVIVPPRSAQKISFKPAHRSDCVSADVPAVAHARVAAPRSEATGVASDMDRRPEVPANKRKLDAVASAPDSDLEERMLASTGTDESER